MQKKYYIITYGCQMNKNDSEHIAGMLESDGYTLANDSEQADVVVVNTCAIRDKAERKFYGQLNILDHYRRTASKNQQIWVTGCICAYDEQKVWQTAPFIDKIFPIAQARLYPARRRDVNAWVSIMQGCNNFCSYCIVPYTRGREHSRAVAEILAEITGLSDYQELVLLGQNVNSYCGEHQGRAVNFAQLLTMVLKILPPNRRLSFLTSHPKDISSDLITVIANNSVISRELHFPIQAGSDRILQLMNRKYTKQDYIDLVKKIRQEVPDILISTDLIVGFPGETIEEFQETVDLVKQLAFYRVNSAAYSPRQGTVAATMPQQLTEKEKNRRLNLLNQIIKQYALVHNKAKIL